MSDWQRGNDWTHPIAKTVCETWFKNYSQFQQLFVMFGREPKDGDDKLLWHISISVRSNRLVNAQGNSGMRIPTEVNMAMMFPPKRMWISLPGSTVIHLWEIPVEFAEQP